MANIRNMASEIYSLEQLSGKNTVAHRLHPIVKMFSAFLFIVTVISFGRYEFGRMIPYVFFPVILIAVSETPHFMLFKRVLLALPFCLFIGLSNIFFDRATAFTISGISISYGAISLFVILFRTYLCVMAVLILIAITPFSELTAQLRRLKAPDIFVTTLEMTYRYIGVLLEEAASMHMAYTLRGAMRHKKGIDMRHMGSFVGQLLLRSFDRAERVYHAMKCRGFAQRRFQTKKRKLTVSDIFYLIIVCVFCVLFRVFDICGLFIAWFGGLF